MGLYEILKASKLGAGAAPDMYTALLAQKINKGGSGGEAELSGVPPLTFPADGTPLIDLLISGNMIQSGTPTRENPIQSQGCGNKTANLIEGMFSGSIGTTGGIAYSNQYVIYYVPVTAGETYTISGSYYVYAYYANKPTVGTASAIDNERHFTSQGNTITAISGASWIGIRATSEDIPMVNLGSTPLPYENYGYKIPISSANITTPVYLGEVETTRKIKKLVLTGDEDTWKQSGAASNTFYVNVLDYLRQKVNITICSHYTSQANINGATEMQNGKVAFYANAGQTGKYFYVRDDNFATLSDLKAWLAAQYAAGTPVTVWYVLATPTTGIVNEPLRKIGDYADTLSMEQASVQIPTNRGNTVIDVLTELKPSEVYIKYRT